MYAFKITTTRQQRFKGVAMSKELAILPLDTHRLLRRDLILVAVGLARSLGRFGGARAISARTAPALLRSPNAASARVFSKPSTPALQFASRHFAAATGDFTVEVDSRAICSSSSGSTSMHCRNAVII